VAFRRLMRRKPPADGSAIEHGHGLIRVPVAGRHPCRQVSLQFVHLRGIELHLGRGHILVEVGAALRTGDWGDVLPPWSSQASASCTGVQPVRVAMSRTTATICMSAVRLAGSGAAAVIVGTFVLENCARLAEIVVIVWHTALRRVKIPA